jgi:hypothetical protein
LGGSALPSFADAACGEGEAVFVKGEGAEFGFGDGRGAEALQNCLHRLGRRGYRIKCLHNQFCRWWGFLGGDLSS